MDGRAGDPPRHHGRSVGLDLMRSLAVLLVVLAHYASAMLGWFGIVPPHGVFFLGDIGVDLFFALSGFLIGRILIGLAARTPTRRALLVFWVRRWMRTLPVYLVWLAVLAAVFPPPAARVRTLLHYATLTQNVWRPMPADNWFAVSWSLTVEEWFYLLFGAAVVLGAAILRRTAWALLVPLAVMLAVPLGLRLSVSTEDFYLVGYWKMVPFRLDEIGYGVILAWLFTRGSGVFRWPWTMMAAGLLLVGMAWAMVPVELFRFYTVIRNDLTVAGCALCLPAALCLRVPSWLDRLAVHGSRLSYAVYLVHLTFLTDIAGTLLAQQKVSRAGAVAIAVAGMLGASELLSRCVERPLMRLRPAQ